MEPQQSLQTFESPPAVVQVDADGDLILPDTVEEFEQQDNYLSLQYKRATDTVVESEQGVDLIKQAYEHIWIKSPYDVDGWKVLQGTGTDRRQSDADLITTAETKQEAAEEALGWMEAADPIQSKEVVPRPGANDRDWMEEDARKKEAKAVREGSTVYLDRLPGCTVREELSDQQFQCETPDGSSFTLHIDTSIRGFICAYTHPYNDTDHFRIARHVTTSNEENLRDSVATDLYTELKEHIGETVIRVVDSDVDVHELEELRDGFVNPADTDLDPDDATRGTPYIDDSERGSWYLTDPGIPPGRYRLTTRGVVPSHDPHGTTVFLTPDEWAALDIDIDLNAELVEEITTSIPVQSPDEADSITPDDPLTELAGVGPATAEQAFSDSVGQLYEWGLPLPYVEGQYVPTLLNQMATLGDRPLQREDAIRFITGLIGGMALDDDGEVVGSAASALAGEFDPDEAVHGWTSPTESIKDEYTPTWLEKSESRADISTIGVLSCSPAEVHNRLDEIRTNLGLVRTVATNILVGEAAGDTAAVTTADEDLPAIKTRKQIIQIAGTLTGIPLDGSPEFTSAVTCWTAEQDDEDAVLFFDHPTQEWGVLISPTLPLMYQDLFGAESEI